MIASLIGDCLAWRRSPLVDFVIYQKALFYLTGLFTHDTVVADRWQNSEGVLVAKRNPDTGKGEMTPEMGWINLPNLTLPAVGYL